MDLNNMVFPNPKQAYSIRFPLLYRIPRDKTDFSVDTGTLNENAFLSFSLKMIAMSTKP